MSALLHFVVRSTGMVGLLKERFLGLPLRTFGFPLPGPAYRGAMAVKEAGAGVSDRIFACLKRSDGIYDWAQVYPVGPIQIRVSGGNNIPAGANGAESRSCNANETLIGGGCSTSVGLHLIRQSYPASLTTWQCGSRNTSSVTDTLTAYAICLQTPIA